MRFLIEATHANHNIKILSQIDQNPSKQLRVISGKLEYENRYIPGIVRTFSGDSRVKIVKVLQDTVTIATELFDCIKDLKRESRTYIFLTLILQAIIDVHLQFIGGLTILSKMYSDINLSLDIDKISADFSAIIENYLKSSD